jgi:hypothetical protein
MDSRAEAEAVSTVVGIGSFHHQLELVVAGAIWRRPLCFSMDFSPAVWKGGALAPPLQGALEYSHVPRPPQLAAASCGGRGTNREREARFRRG